MKVILYTVFFWIGFSSLVNGQDIEQALHNNLERGNIDSAFFYAQNLSFRSDGVSSLHTYIDVYVAGLFWGFQHQSIGDSLKSYNYRLLVKMAESPRQLL